MTTLPPAESPASATSDKSLHKVLDKSEQIKNVVDECAEELSSVNAVLKQEHAIREPSSQEETALQKSAEVESKVQDVADELAMVNVALEQEIEERHLLEHQLAAAEDLEKSARHIAFHDYLTGLPNRILFNDRLEHGLAQAKRHGWTLAIMFVDLDNFKTINDTYGHDVGDSVLKIVSKRLADVTRDDDTVCRHGGDEFVYLLMEVKDKPDISVIAEKIIRTIQNPCQVEVRDHKLTLSIKPSIGISIYPMDGDNAAELLKIADSAMYEAKRTGSGYAFSSTAAQAN